MSQANTVAVARAANVASVQHYIAGEFRPSRSGGWFETLDPSTNSPITTVAAGGADDVDTAVQEALAAQRSSGWAQMSPPERGRLLNRIADAIEERSDELVWRECLDSGLPIAQARGQAERAAYNFRFFASVLTTLSSEAFPVGQSFLGYTVRKPVGVVGVITPWNTPFMLASWRLAPALAAGNSVVFKPPEWAPLSAQIFAEAVDEAGLPPGVFNIVHGDGSAAGAALARHPAVSAIAFTGSGETAAKIMSAGVASLKRHSFELGGKSPVVIFGDADLERAVDAAVFGVFSLNGERCTAGSRLLVEQSIYDDFVDAVANRAAAVRVGDPFDMATELGPLIHPLHLRRVQGFIAQGRSEGRVVAGGDRPENQPPGNYIEATVIADVGRDARVFQEEIFGPVVTVSRFKTDQEALELANATRYGLAAYVWTSDLQRGHRIAQGIDSGLVWVNSHNVRDLRTPFGGVKQSGNRYEGGHWSFDFYCDLQTVHIALSEHRIPRFGSDDRGEAVVRANDTTL